jgi:hypothetical protein
MATMKQAYALRARPKSHAAAITATVSELCNTVTTHSCGEMSR